MALQLVFLLKYPKIFMALNYLELPLTQELSVFPADPCCHLVGQLVELGIVLEHVWPLLNWEVVTVVGDLGVLHGAAC